MGKSKVGRPKLTVPQFEVNSQTRKRIAQLARLSGYSPQQVFEDALKSGLVEVQDIYESIAEFRSTLETEWNANDAQPISTQESAPASAQPTESGPSDPFALYDAASNGSRETSDLAELGTGDERSGHVAAPINDPPASATSDIEPLLSE